MGCGPLDAAYTGQIGTRRLQNLNPKDAEEFLRLDSLLEGGGGTDADLARLGTLADKADHFQELQIQEPESFPPDSRAYGSLWPEISRLRKSGGLLDVFPKISCPIVLIQGENDPHPPAGVSAPLEHLGIPLRQHLLPRCGHNPVSYTHLDVYKRQALSPAEGRTRRAHNLNPKKAEEGLIPLRFFCGMLSA